MSVYLWLENHDLQSPNNLFKMLRNPLHVFNWISILGRITFCFFVRNFFVLVTCQCHNGRWGSWKVPVNRHLIRSPEKGILLLNENQSLIILRKKQFGSLLCGLFFLPQLFIGIPDPTASTWAASDNLISYNWSKINVHFLPDQVFLLCLVTVAVLYLAYHFTVEFWCCCLGSSIFPKLFHFLPLDIAIYYLY